MSLGDEYENTGGYGGSGQTRTRMPDSGGPHGGGRRGGGRTSSRSLVTVVGVVVLLIAAIAFANRGGDDSASGGDDDSPKAEATAPSGEKPVRSANAGIPSGFARDRQGAESAAANYSVALGSADLFNTDRRREITTAVYTPEVAAARQADLDRAYSNEEFLANIGLDKDGKAPAGQTFISRVIPVGTKVTKSTDNDATVEVWYTSLFGLSGERSSNPVTESWYTTTYQLKWVENDWKITDFQQKDGPVPVGRDQQASTAEDMTKAVEEFGGFTYAR
ncbi:MULTISPECIES: hypothetical protein [unclassified Streptomyces]|uniref:hypothetical protein n=1 Tax=unclassified Streptomyces TaxID=2593676 RepID=UPI0005A77069|nr:MULTISPECIES: hypothetical protein [unclassified Streptomyces]ODA75453.1 hypothetical protein APS67_000014 [Streptomyces sp. AVP053U2]